MMVLIQTAGSLIFIRFAAFIRNQESERERQIFKYPNFEKIIFEDILKLALIVCPSVHNRGKKKDAWFTQLLFRMN